jgi:hypothetical protein
MTRLMAQKVFFLYLELQTDLEVVAEVGKTSIHVVDRWEEKVMLDNYCGMEEDGEGDPYMNQAVGMNLLNLEVVVVRLYI